MVDEVADNGSIGHQASYVRYISPDGDIMGAFVTEIELPSRIAEVIIETLEKELTYEGMSLADMSGFCLWWNDWPSG